MLLLDFFQWWYGSGWLQRVSMIGVQINRWAGYFSLGTILKTLFSPWRQIINRSGANRSISDKFSAVVDNIISRLVGFWVRVFAFVAGVLTVILAAAIQVLIVIIWPLLPVAPIVVVALGVFVL